jgi:hypothetical protein
MDCYCDYDPPEFYNAQVIKAARKRHKCDECDRPMLPGENYERVTGKWEGELSVLTTCSNCLDIRQFVKNSVPCFCWAHGSMHDDAYSAIQDAYYRARDEVKGLFMGYGRRLIACRRKRSEIAKAEART